MKTIFLALIYSLIFLCSISIAEPALQYAGSGIWSGFEALNYPGGDYLFAGFPYGLGVFDVSDSLDCYLREWEFIGAQVNNIKIVGNYAYLAAGSKGLAIINISNPLNLTLVSTLDIGEIAKGIDVSGNYAIVAGSAIGIYVVDITNPAAPVRVGNLTMTGGCMHVFTEGNFAYVSRGLGGFAVVDFSTPTAPALRGTYSSSTLIREAAKSGNFVFLAAELAGITVLDVTNPSALSVAGTYPAPSGRSLSTIAILGNVAYVGAGNYGVLSLDITSPSSITQIDRYPMSTTSVIRVAVSGGMLYFSTSEGLQVLDVGTSPTTITFVSRENLHAGIEYVWGGGSKLLTSSGVYGIDGFNMPTPYEPLQTFNYTNSHRFYAAIFYNHYVFSAEATYGLGVLRSTSLAEYPDPIRMLSVGGTAKDVARVDTMLYVLTTIGITQLKVTNPESPMIFWDAPIAGAGAFFPTRNYVYVVDTDEGFVVLETGMMTEVGRDATASGLDYAGMTVFGNFAYVAAGDDGLIVFDISTPTAPVRVRQITTPDDAVGVTSANGWVYVAVDRQGVLPLKIVGEGDSLVAYDSFPTGGRSKGIYAEGQYVFVADRYAVMILRNIATGIEEKNALPVAAEMSIWPNPFNSSCRFDPPLGSLVRIFDASGRLVAELPAHFGEAVWTPEAEISSGNYLINSVSGEKTVTGRATYIK